jgi:uncharacterized protein
MAAGLAFVLMLGLPAQQTPQQLGREAVDLLLAGKYAALVERFAPQMRTVLPEEKLRQAAQSLAPMGAVKNILEPQVQVGQGMTVVIVPVDFEKMGVNIQITLDGERRIAGMFIRPRLPPAGQWQRPAYSRPDSFRDEQVRFGEPGWELPGTLSIPGGEGPFPTVVLVHGSGPNDRDETLGPNKPFRDIAEGLASRGIAVLRYDKRTLVHGAKFAAMGDFTLNHETVDDAVAAAAFLRSRPEVDGRRVFVLGHSLGGYAVPRIAGRDPKLGGAIVLAGNTRSLLDLVVEQTAYLSGLQPPSPEQQKRLDELTQAVERVRNLKEGDKFASGEMAIGAPASYWLDLKDYRPAELARHLKMPLLVLHGERDYQVTMADFAGWREALKDVKTATLRTFPNLNHLFAPGEGKSTPGEYLKPGQHVAPEVVETIAEWIGKH